MPNIMHYFQRLPESSSSSGGSSVVVANSMDITSSSLSTAQTSIASSSDPETFETKNPVSTPPRIRRTGFKAINDASRTSVIISEASRSLKRSPTKKAARGLSGETVVRDINQSKQKLLDDGIEALDMDWTLPNSNEILSEKRENQKQDPSRLGKAARAAAGALSSTASSLGKRARGAVESGKEKLRPAANNDRRKISRLQEIEEKEEQEEQEPLRKKTRLSEVPNTDKTSELQQMPARGKQKQKQTKRWLNSGLYAGQPQDFDPRFSRKANEARKNGKVVIAPKIENGSLPMPMFSGQKLFEFDREFNLPFDVFSPLPAKQPKPEEWKKTQSNRFVGDAATEWKKTKPLPTSRCVCTPDTGCDEDCQNRFMFYECDDDNCSIGAEFCTNRAFADLRKRCKTGRKYDFGVEVCKTASKGFGVRACRSFEPNQIIVEYAGEIITQEECERRMNDEYKNNECYYLMVFDQNMIIDATRGTIARFINHSCEPNCAMIKWTVAGKPRMALFAGPDGVMTGDELTYDYNFDPFSQKNVQACHCGTPSCRGFLGPRPSKGSERERERDSSSKPPERSLSKSTLIAGAKRKFQELVTEPSSSSSQQNSQQKHERNVLQKKRRVPPAAPGHDRVSALSSTNRNGQRNVSSSTGETTLVDTEADDNDFVIRKTATLVETARPRSGGSSEAQHVSKKRKLSKSAGNVLSRVGSSLKRTGSKIAASSGIDISNVPKSHATFPGLKTKHYEGKGRAAMAQLQVHGEAQAQSGQMNMFDFGFAGGAGTQSRADEEPEKKKPKEKPMWKGWVVLPEEEAEERLKSNEWKWKSGGDVLALGDGRKAGKQTVKVVNPEDDEEENAGGSRRKSLRARR